MYSLNVLGSSRLHATRGFVLNERKGLFESPGVRRQVEKGVTGKEFREDSNQSKGENLHGIIRVRSREFVRVPNYDDCTMKGSKAKKKVRLNKAGT